MPGWSRLARDAWLARRRPSDMAARAHCSLCTYDRMRAVPHRAHRSAGARVRAGGERGRVHGGRAQRARDLQPAACGADQDRGRLQPALHRARCRAGAVACHLPVRLLMLLQVQGACASCVGPPDPCSASEAPPDVAVNCFPVCGGSASDVLEARSRICAHSRCISADASCASSNALGAPASGTLLKARPLDVRALFEARA